MIQVGATVRIRNLKPYSPCNIQPELFVGNVGKVVEKSDDGRWAVRLKWAFGSASQDMWRFEEDQLEVCEE